MAKQNFSPTKLKELTYKVVVERLTEHFSPKPIAIAQRCKFNRRYCQPRESVAVFCAELQKLAEFYEFGDSLENMLRDRLHGVQNFLQVHPEETLGRTRPDIPEGL